LNRQTFLTCDEFVLENHVLLEKVFEDLEKVDKVLLEQLHYNYKLLESDLDESEGQRLKYSKAL